MIGNIYAIKEADGTSIKGVLTAFFAENEIEITFGKGNTKIISRNELNSAELVQSNEALMATTSQMKHLKFELITLEGKKDVIEVLNPYFTDISGYPLIVQRVRDIIGALNATAINHNLPQRYAFQIGKMTVDPDTKELRLDLRKYAGYFKVYQEINGEVGTLFEKYYTFEDFKEYTGSFAWADNIAMNFLYECVGMYIATVNAAKNIAAQNEEIARQKQELIVKA